MLATRLSFRRAFGSSLFAGFFLASSAYSGGFESFCRDFVRGDANADGIVDLSDGVFTLNALFSGGATPACESALDADDSGEIELTDAVFTFRWLFLGGQEPPAPGPVRCGQDPTFDELTCERSPVCDPEGRVRDFSEARSFVFRVSGGLGFCPDFGGIGAAEILRGEDGSLEASISLFAEGEPGDEASCLPGTVKPGCVVLEELPPHLLSDEESARWAELTRAIEVFSEPEPYCRCVAIDPCTVDHVEWDGESFTDFPCAGARISFETMREIRGFLRQLIET